MKRDYTLLKPHTVNREKLQPGAVVSLTHELATWLAEQGVIKMPDTPEIPALLTPPERFVQPRTFAQTQPRRGCRGCGW